ncbi:COG0436 Aspartate/tyrosine/aromatic aminotransferase [Rhabdaerophilaceae bacterium]
MSNFVPAKRVSRIKPSPSVAAAALARELKAQGRDIVDLTVGEPDFDTPEPIREAGKAAIDLGETRYTAVNGTPALREAICTNHTRLTGQACPQNRITIGGGAKQVIFLAFMASLDTGDEVIIPAPYWVSYPDMVLANDGTPVIVPSSEAEGFKIGPEALERAITPRTKWLVFNIPGNPSGAAYGANELQAMAAVLRRHPHVRILMDDIYDQVWFDDQPIIRLGVVAPDLSDRIFAVNGVSKTYAMTGWRIGWGIGEPDLIGAINTLQSQMSSCPSSISQAAAAAALNGPQLFPTEASAVYRRRRDIAATILRSAPGLSCLSPSGAFYLFPGCGGLIGKATPQGTTIANDKDFVLYLLEHAGVATVHGAAYGLSPHFRLSIATSDAVLREGCERIAAAAAALR